MAILSNVCTLLSHFLDPNLFFHFPRKKKGSTATKTTFLNISPPLRWLQVILGKKKKEKKKAFNWNN